LLLQFPWRHSVGWLYIQSVINMDCIKWMYNCYIADMGTGIKPVWNILIVNCITNSCVWNTCCNLARYWLQAVWGWHDNVETCSSVIICDIIVCICWSLYKIAKNFLKQIFVSISDCTGPNNSGRMTWGKEKPKSVIWNCRI
jgi:hypothetical protein